MRILVLHTNYQQKGGEDFVFQNELNLLKSKMEVDSIVFTNKSGILGGVQFIFSIWNIIAAKKLIRKIHQFKPDLIHIHNIHFGIGPIAIRASKKCGVPVIMTLHNYRILCPSGTLLNKTELFTESLKLSFPWIAVRKKLYRNSFIQTFWLATSYWIHKKIGSWRLVDKYIALTAFSKQLFIDSTLGFEHNKIVVKPNFIVHEVVKPETKSKSFLFVGRLSDEKGIKVLLQAFRSSHYIIKIAGDGPLKAEIKKLSTNRNNIIYLGNLKREEVKKEMLRSAALIFPSIWYEGMPMTIIEAFSCGVPVISSNLGAMKDMIEDGYNGFHFKPGDHLSLLKALHRWENSSAALKTEMSQNAQKSYHSLYTPEHNFSQLFTIYQAVINEQKKIA